MAFQVTNIECLEGLKLLDSESLDSLVTDPPAAISFMGAGWDSDRGGRQQWVLWLKQILEETLRVLKPGAYGLIWAFPKTAHWTTLAAEDAGFEVRDVIVHVFGGGMPKSQNIQKFMAKSGDAEIRKQADKWAGFGTSFKPASEHWILVRKPIIGTVANNVGTYGTGAINIDASRVPFANTADEAESKEKNQHEEFESGPRVVMNVGGERKGDRTNYDPPGRWPPNVLLSHTLSCWCGDDNGAEIWDCIDSCPIRIMDEVSGISGDGDGRVRLSAGTRSASGTWSEGTGSNKAGHTNVGIRDFGDKGGPSRFFPRFSPHEPDTYPFVYAAKASKKERNLGGIQNRHPCLKSIPLMRYLVRMVTPPGGTVLDPFAGSGSTLVAALLEDVSSVGFEEDETFAKVALDRAAYTANHLDEVRKLVDKKKKTPSVEITVNGKPHQLTQTKITYGEILVIAGYKPHRVITVTYQNGTSSKPEGCLLFGTTIALSSGMRFNACDTSSA